MENRMDFINFARYMKYYLTIDRGNSQLKGGLWNEEGTLVGFESAPTGRAASSVALDLLTPVFGGTDAQLGGCAYSSVVKSATEADLSGLEPLCDLVLEVNAAVKLPFSIGYATPETLGADRIAAVAGALTLAPEGRNILVVDAGTAVTYEFVSADRVYLGGNIAPGLELRIKSLHEHTSALPMVSLDGPAPLIGTSTQEAIRSGALRGLLAEILYYLSQQNATAVLTGGGCACLEEQSLITFEHITDAHLVLRGLYSILRYNEIN